MVTEISPAALSAEESAKYLGVPRETFKRLASFHKIPGIRMGNRWVYRVASLESFLAEQETKQQTSGEGVKS